MDNSFTSLDEIDTSELSEKDLAILQAFEAMDCWSATSPETSVLPPGTSAFVHSLPPSTPASDEEMLQIFMAEAEEDVANMQRILKQLSQDDYISPTHFSHLQRIGHKLYGTAGAIGFPVMSAIASQIETIAEQVREGRLFPIIGVHGLAQAIASLAQCQAFVSTHKKEPDGNPLLAALNATYRDLNIHFQDFRPPSARPALHHGSALFPDAESSAHTGQYQRLPATPRVTTPLPLDLITEASHAQQRMVSIEAHHLETLTQHVEHLSELNTLLEEGKKQVERSLRDLHRFQQIPSNSSLSPITAHLQAAYAHLTSMQQQYMSCVAAMRRDMLPIPHPPSSSSTKRANLRDTGDLSSLGKQCLDSTRQASESPKPISILLVDDVSYLRHLVRRTLQYNNYRLIEAKDGLEALEKLREHTPDICLLDVEMPNLNGFDVLTIIHQTPAYRHMKVIMLTSRNSEKDRQHAKELGAHYFLSKPCSPEILLKTIHDLLHPRGWT